MPVRMRRIVIIKYVTGVAGPASVNNTIEFAAQAARLFTGS